MPQVHDHNGSFFVVIRSGTGAGSGWGRYDHIHEARERRDEMRSRNIDAVIVVTLE